MKYRLIILALILCLGTIAGASEKGCPAHRAAQEGYNPLKDFHKIMAPAWHNDWPDKNYDALIAVGPEFKEAFKGIAEIKPEFKLEYRNDIFLKNRSEFEEIVNKYAVAAESKDKEAVYKLMPDLHKAFEMTASSLLPIYFPLLDGLIITNNAIMENFLPQNDMKSITNSTDTLVSQINSFTEEDIPEELVPVKNDIVKEFDQLEKIITRMKESCDKNDIKSYQTNIERLNFHLEQILDKYI